MTTIYTAEEVARHNRKTDLWVSIHAKVYDLTTYLEDHPGGVPSIVEVAGNDATAGFEDVGHTEHARKILERFLIGKLDHEEESLATTTVRQLAPEPSATSQLRSNVTLVLSVAKILSMGAVVVIAFIITRKIDRIIAVEGGRSIASSLRSFLPWLTSTSVASIFIQHSAKQAPPSTAPARRPAHFKIDNSTTAARAKPSQAILKAGQYIELPVSTVERLSADSNKITLKLPTPEAVLGLPTGQHISIRTCMDGKEISRQYTPTSSNKDLGRLELVIKNYDDGQLTGRCLKNIQPGDIMSISGPKGQMHYRRGLARTINMIAGGTGITPMYQIIRAICEDPRDTTKINLIYANQTEADILLRQELDSFVEKHADQLQVHYILSRPGQSWSGRVGRCTQQVCQELFASGADKSNKAMICGPQGMVDNAKEWLVNLDYDCASVVSKMRDQVFVF